MPARVGKVAAMCAQLFRSASFCTSLSAKWRVTSGRLAVEGAGIAGISGHECQHAAFKDATDFQRFWRRDSTGGSAPVPSAKVDRTADKCGQKAATI
ncbi:hypothetical protein J6590_059979, partial [Homalodisca vitripennis]